MPIIDEKASNHLHKIQKQNENRISSKLLRLAVVAVLSVKTGNIPARENLSFTCFLLQKISEGVVLRRWFPDSFVNVLANFERCEWFRVFLRTNGRSTSLSSLAWSSCFLIISSMFRSKNVRFCTTPREVANDILAHTISVLWKYFFYIFIYNILASLILRTLDL